MSLLVACSGNTTNDDPGPGAGIQHNVTENGIVDQVRDPADFEVATASDASGWLEIKRGRERIFLPRGSRYPDLSIYQFGRADVEQPTSSSKVAFELSGLGAWQNGDSLQLVSPNVGMAFTGVESGFGAYPGIGSTTISGETLDWKAALVPLIDAAKGDTTWVTQMANRRTSSGSYYSVLTSAGVARAFTVKHGGDSTLSAALAPVAPDRKLALQWRGSQFAAMASQVSPNAQPAAAPALSIRALPDVLARNNNYFRRFYTNLPTLVDFGPISGSTDLDQNLEYGNPFSSKGAKWTEFVTMAYAMPVGIPTPEGVGTVNAMMVSAIPVEELGESGVIAPTLSPVRNAKLDGQSLDAPRTAGGASPTLTWEAPAIGTATSYAVTVHAIETSRTGVRVKKLATFYTKSASLQVPSSVVRSASSYVLTITAISAKGVDLASRPFVGSLPYASADHVTARIINSDQGR